MTPDVPGASSTAWKLRYAGHLGLRNPDTPMFANSARSPDPVDQIDRLADLGFAGVQDIYLKLRSPQVQARMGARRASLGLEMGTFNLAPALWKDRVWIADDASARIALRAELLSALEARDRVGGGAAVCVSLADPERPRDLQRAAMAEHLKRLAEPAERAGLTLLVEPVAAAYLPGFLIDRLADAAALVRAVDNPAVRLLFDIAHVQTSEGEVLENLKACWDVVGGLQAADTPGRRDLGAGEIDLPPILRWVRDQGYAGLIELEHEPVEPGVAGEGRLIERLRRTEAAI
jgi:hydroxypyruvate isomerase